MTIHEVGKGGWEQHDYNSKAAKARVVIPNNLRFKLQDGNQGA